MTDENINKLLNIRAPMPDLDDQEKNLNEEQNYVYEHDDYEDDEYEDEENDVDYDNYDEDEFDEDDEDESAPPTSEEATRIMERMSEVLNRIENTESVTSDEAVGPQPRIRPHFTPAPRFVPPQREVLNALFREALPEPPTEAPTEAPRPSSNLEPLTNPHLHETISLLIETDNIISEKEFEPMDRVLIDHDINKVYDFCLNLRNFVKRPDVGVPSETD